MAIIGIAAGIFVFLLTGAFTGQVLVHNNEAGIFPGLVAGIWAAWPFFHWARVERHNFLHPVPKEYRVPAKIAFAKIRDLLAEVSYNYGDRWHVTTADTQSGRICASLRFTDEHVRIEADARGQIHTRKERLQRLLRLNVLVTDTGRDTAIVQLDFNPKVEGANFSACDAIVSAVTSQICTELGTGTAVAEELDGKLPSPPLWLIAMGAVAIFTLLGDVMNAILK